MPQNNHQSSYSHDILCGPGASDRQSIAQSFLLVYQDYQQAVEPVAPAHNSIRHETGHVQFVLPQTHISLSLFFMLIAYCHQR